MKMQSLRIFVPWVAAIAYLFLAPIIRYAFFTSEGKPVGVLDQLPQETGRIRYNVEELKYWEENHQVLEEVETYALWGWAFLDNGEGLQDYSRYIILSSDKAIFLFSVEDYPRPGVQDAFATLRLPDLTLSGFYAPISRNALPKGSYRVGILFEKIGNPHVYYFVNTDKVLKRSPNHLILEDMSE